MPPRIASLSELVNSLDAATYFFVSSGIFIVVASVLFFALGLWLGGLIWSQYKRRFRQAEQAIEAFKGEVAMLKRRLAEQSTRPSPAMGPSPLQSIAFRTAPQTETTPTVITPTIPTLPGASVHPGVPLALGTEPDRRPEAPTQTHLREAIHAESPAAKSARQEWPASRGSSTTAALPAWRLLFGPSEVLMVPRSRAFSIWTERNWNPPPVRSFPLPAAQGFALWTEPDFEPLCNGPLWTSRAHTLWSTPGWTPSYKPGPPSRSARSFTIWTEAGWKLPSNLPRSRAFCVWTEESWRATPVVGQAPMRPGAGWSLWTVPDFIPASRGVQFPSRAFTLWAEPSKEDSPAAESSFGFAGKPFTIWTETHDEGTPATNVQANPKGTERSALVVTKRPGFVSRAFAAARQALGFGNVPAKSEEGRDQGGASSSPGLASTIPVPVPRTVGPPERPVVSVKSAPIPETPSGVSVGKSVTESPAPSENSAPPLPAVPAFVGPLPPSHAFTIWTGAPANPSARRINQSTALAALIESRTSGAKAPTTPTHESTMPPVPLVQPSEDAASGQSPGAAPLPILDLEPLSVPGEESDR